MALLVPKHPRGFLLAGGALVLLASPAWAEDFWKKKPSAEWTVEEALKLVQDSPWAHDEVVMRLQLPRARPINRSDRFRVPRRNPRSPRPMPRSPRPPRRPSPELMGPRDALAWASYLVRWESAALVAEAFARLEELDARASAHFQSPPPRLPEDRYVITVKTTRPPRDAPDLFEGLDNEELRQHAHLKTHRGRIAPVEVERSGLGANAAVHFFFPRTDEGEPLLHPEGERVEFRFVGKRFTLKSKFRVEPSFLR